MAAGLPDEAPEAIKKRLAELWPSYSDALRQSLEARMSDRTKGLEKRLKEREQKEINDITAILQELRRTIEAELAELRKDTQPLLFNDEEQRQFDRDLLNLRNRVKQIPKEIEQEKEAIRARFANPQPRMFPVAVTFYVPEKSV